MENTFNKAFAARFLKLPIHIQVLIVKFLPRETRQVLLTEVPNLFEILTLDSSLWDTIELTGPFMRTGRACKLLMKSPYYTKVMIVLRSDLNKLIKILLQSPRLPYLTHISFSMCKGSEKIREPAVKGNLLYKLITSCPCLIYLRLEDISRSKALQLFNYLGTNFNRFKCIYADVERLEMVNFFKNAQTSVLSYLHDESITGFRLESHILEMLESNDAFCIHVNDENKHFITLKSLEVAICENHDLSMMDIMIPENDMWWTLNHRWK